MSAIKQAFWLLASLIALAISSWYFASSKPSFELDQQALDHTVDVTIHKLRVYQYDKSGQLSHFMKTPFLNHTPNNNTHWIQHPLVLVAQEGKSPLKIQAKEATSFFGGEKIVFNQNVLICQNQNSNTPGSTLTTESMTYYPKKKLASTTKDVLFKQPGSIVQSHGMRALLDEKRVQLLNKARGTYEPAHG